MRQPFLVGVATLALCMVLPVHAAPAAAGEISSAAFYIAPTPLPAAAHGTVIRSAPLHGSAALPSAARNILVLYHSKGTNGANIAVSGTIAIPQGIAPDGGWPVTTWAHGTTGIGPACAPSKDTADGAEHAFLGPKQALMDDYVKRGYVVVATDYEGLWVGRGCTPSCKACRPRTALSTSYARPGNWIHGSARDTHRSDIRKVGMPICSQPRLARPMSLN